MKSSKPSAQVSKREDVFVKQTATQIWHESPSEENPYIAAECRCHGYDLLDLLKKRSFVDVLYLSCNTPHEFFCIRHLQRTAQQVG